MLLVIKRLHELSIDEAKSSYVYQSRIADSEYRRSLFVQRTNIETDISVKIWQH